MMLLDVSEIDTFYGLSHILFQLSLEADDHQLVCLLGRNGVGKTTALRSIMGLTPPQSGSITFLGEKISGRKAYDIARRGIGFVPEERIIFPDLTVNENLEIGVKKGEGAKQWTLGRTYEMFPELKGRENQKGGTLSGGEQQMLSIARTLMGNPRLLLLDEPLEGLAPLVVKTIMDKILLLKEEGLSILLSEQMSDFALKISDRVYILEKGHICWNGKTKELEENPAILRQYLGV